MSRRLHVFLCMLLAGAGSGLAQGQIRSQLAPLRGGPQVEAPQRSAAARATPPLGQVYTQAHMYLQKARRAKQAGRLEEAASFTRKILGMPFPSDEKSQRFLGPIAANLVVLLKSQGRWEEAEAAVRQGLSKVEKPGVPVTYHVMLLHSLHGEVLDQLGRSKQAAAAQKRAEEIEHRLSAEN